MWAPTLSVSLREITPARDEEAAPSVIRGLLCASASELNMGCRGCYGENPRDDADLDPLTFGLSQQGHNQNIIMLLSDSSSEHRRAQFEKLHFCVAL